MPDGHGYQWITRAPSKTFAVRLGCDIAYASQTVYATGLDLDDAEGRTPIGPGCKVCDRVACPQRAFPFVGRTLQVDENTSDFLPYRHEVDR